MDLVLITGKAGSGKTTAAMQCVHRAWQSSWTVGGIVAAGNFLEEVRDTYHVVDLASGRKELLAQRNYPSSVRQGVFGFYQEGFALGHLALRKAIQRRVDLLVIDEIGPLELDGGGWADDLQVAVASAPQHLLLTMRPQIKDQVIAVFLPGCAYTSFACEDADQIMTRWQI